MYLPPVLATDNPLGSIQCILGVDEEVMIVAAHPVAQDMAAAMEALVHPWVGRLRVPVAMAYTV